MASCMGVRIMVGRTPLVTTVTAAPGIGECHQSVLDAPAGEGRPNRARNLDQLEKRLRTQQLEVGWTRSTENQREAAVSNVGEESVGAKRVFGERRGRNVDLGDAVENGVERPAARRAVDQSRPSASPDGGDTDTGATEP